MILKHWIDRRGRHEIQLFTYEKDRRLIYQINGDVVDDVTVRSSSSVDEQLGKMIAREVKVL